jgi:outer membrane protein assembly factor BamB
MSTRAWRRCCVWIAAVTAVFLPILHAIAAPSASWPQWRGPNRDGTTADFSPPASWPAALTRHWRTPVGAGHASPVIADGRVFVHARSGEQEVVVAFDAASGRQQWRDAYDAPYRVNPAAAAHGPGPRSTPAVASDRLVTLGISGILSCYDATSGTLRWRRRPVASEPLYGTAMSPLIDGRSVIVHVGGTESGALMAIDLDTGKPRWQWTGGAPAYGSPIIATFSQVRQIVTHSRTHLVGVSTVGGQLLWSVPFATDYDQNAVTPVVAQDLLIYSGLARGTHAVRPVLRGGSWHVERAWSNEDVSMYMSSPIVNEGTLFGFSHRNRGQFFAVDVQSGRTLWTSPGREADNAALVAAHGVVLALTTNAELIVSARSTAAFKEIARYDVADTPTWAHPAVAGSQIIVKDADSVAAWGVDQRRARP